MHQYDVLIWTGIVFILLFLFSFFKLFWSPLRAFFYVVRYFGKIDWLALLEHSAVAFLFFFIGLEYSFERLSGMRRIIKPAFIFTRNFYFSVVAASALYPSSTAITVKLLSDYRRLALALIFEDLVSIVLLSLFGGKIGVLSLPIEEFSL